MILLSAATSLAVAACSSDSGPASGDDTGGDDGAPVDEWDKELAKRQFDYNAALRTAALRLIGDIPTMTEIQRVQNAGDVAAQQAEYEALLREYMSRPAFARQMLYFWRDTFKMGETAEMDFAPAFAAQLSVENGDYTRLFTATSGACPTFNATTGTFTAGDCAGPGPKVGILTDKGMNRQYYGNFAFRRIKWLQETFDCTKFPIDLTGAAEDVGGPTPYTGAFPFRSISGTENGGRVNFLDRQSVICAGCHQTLNHRARLFANFDDQGVYQNQIAVRTPLPNEPLALALDYLPQGEPDAYRVGVPTPSLAAFGAAMAADPGIARCGVARVWNWALGKQDIVEALVEVPNETIQGHVDAFTQGGFKVKDLIYRVYTDPNFTKF
jgi:hypothetical protein